MTCEKHAAGLEPQGPFAALVHGGCVGCEYEAKDKAVIKLAARVAELEEAMRKITALGRVCDEFEVCKHRGCADSCAAVLIALEASGPTASVGTEPATTTCRVCEEAEAAVCSGCQKQSIEEAVDHMHDDNGRAHCLGCARAKCAGVPCAPPAAQRTSEASAPCPACEGTRVDLEVLDPDDGPTDCLECGATGIARPPRPNEAKCRCQQVSRGNPLNTFVVNDTSACPVHGFGDLDPRPNEARQVDEDGDELEPDARDASYSWNELHAQRREARLAAIEECAKEAERSIIEYATIDVLDTTPEKHRIARRIRALATPTGSGGPT